mgnify:CR=1 FL=1
MLGRLSHQRGHTSPFMRTVSVISRNKEIEKELDA